MNSQFDYLFKVLVVGDSGTGKSSLLNKYVDDTFNELQISTIGVDFKISTQEINGKIIKLQIWDMAGQERFRNIISSYYRGGECIIVVFDLTNRESFDNLNNWISEIDTYGRKNPNPIIFVVGNKVDKIKDRKISYEEAKLFAEKYEAQYIETSAKTNVNIEKLFIDVSSTLLEKNKDKKRETIKITSETKDCKYKWSNNCC